MNARENRDFDDENERHDGQERGRGMAGSGIPAPRPSGPDDAGDVVNLFGDRDTHEDMSPDSTPDMPPDSSPDTDPDTRQDSGEPIEGTIVPRSAADVVMVDSPQAQRRHGWSVVALRDAERRPILPTWVRSRTEFAANTTWAAQLAVHTTGYHAVRTPKYATRLAWRAPRGLARLVGGLQPVAVRPGRRAGPPVDRAGRDRASPDEARTYERLSRQRDRRVRWRGIVTTGVVLGLLIAVVGALTLAPTWARGLPSPRWWPCFGVARRPGGQAAARHGRGPHRRSRR